MKFKFIALNTLLLIGILAIVWQARTRWQEAHARRQINLVSAIKTVASLPAVPAPKPEAAPASKYADVATKDLFAKDRNPVVIVDPPKVETPKPMPPLPVVYGVLGLPSGTKAIMANRKNEPGVPVHAGDTVGEFTIVSLDPQNVTFDWNGTEISRKIEDLIDRTGANGNAGGAGGTNVPPSLAQTASQAQIQSPLRSQQDQPQNNVQTNNVPPVAANIGIEVGAPGQSQRACVPGDTSPAGTVVSGYRKTLSTNPFGTVCRWLPAQ